MGKILALILVVSPYGSPDCMLSFCPITIGLALGAIVLVVVGCMVAITFLVLCGSITIIPINTEKKERKRLAFKDEKTNESTDEKEKKFE